MVLTILKWLGIAMLLSLAALWLWEGGYWKIAKFAEVIPNPLTASSSDASYELPGQPKLWEVPDTTSGASEMEYGTDNENTATDYGGADYQNPSDELYAEPATQQVTGRSPYAGVVDLQIGAAQSPDPKSEYVVIHVSDYATLPINVSGWTLQSLFTGTHVVVPLAASPFRQGVVNSVQPIELSAGESVVLSSGVSPVGVSFRETSCTGYLGQTQQFSPPLSNACPRPTDLLPYTEENVSRFGASCIDFVEHLAPCTYPTQIPNDLSNTCRAFLGNTFTYKGCTSSYESRSNMNLNSWRAFDSSARDHWQNSHDTIVLSDSEGRTVATLTY